MVRSIPLLALSWACGPGGAVLGVPSPTTGDETVVLPINPGSGPAAGDYIVVANARALSEDGDTETQLSVSVRDLDGAPVDAVVTVAGARLDAGPGDGDYEGVLPGYARSFPLRIDGPEGSFFATAVGPAPHALDLPPEPIDASRANDLAWDPADASFAAVASGALGRVTLDGDLGRYTFAPGALGVGDEWVSVERAESLELTGAGPSSRFSVSIEVLRQIETTGAPITTDPPTDTPPEPPPTTGSVEGELRVDSQWQNEEGTAWLLLTAVQDATGTTSGTGTEASEAPTVLTLRVDGFQDRVDYEILDVPPGEWNVLGYLDLDATDGEVPAGPTTADPYVEAEVTVTVGAASRLDLRMQDTF